MAYRRHPMLRRKYNYIDPDPIINGNTVAIPEENILKEPEKIPFPNEADTEAGLSRTNSVSALPEFFNRILGSVELDDIILIGLIFLLLQEKIEDEFLLIILIYILIT